MGITLGTLRKRLQGELDVIPFSLTKDLINNSLRDLYDSNDWGFLFKDDYIRTPALISGVAEVTEFDPIVILDAATKALVDAITINDPPIEERQLRILSPSQSDRGVVYQITAYDDGTGELTIDPPFLDVSNTAKQIQIFKSYYTAPEINIGTVDSPEFVVDFKRFEYIISPQMQRRLILDLTPEIINQRDPWRNYSSDPQAVIPHSLDSAGNQLYEFYPAPRFNRVLRVRYLRNGLALSREESQAPNMFSQELILMKAKENAYKWIIANQEKLGIKNVGKYFQLIALLNSPSDQSSLPNLLNRAIKNDEEMFPKAYMGDFAETPYYEFDYDRGLPIGETLLLNF